MNETPQRPDTVRLQNISYAYRQSAVLNAAVELDLFTTIAGGITTLSKIATALDISATNAERLLVACEALGLVSKKGDHYINAPDVEGYLTSAGFTEVSVNDFVPGSLSRVTGYKPD